MIVIVSQFTLAAEMGVEFGIQVTGSYFYVS